MACGKSTLGRELHHRLGYPLMDMDQIIEARSGKTIAAIFTDDGEPAFRDMETTLLRELHDPSAQRRIISTGGGVVGRAENRSLIKSLGYVVWLDAPARVILDRTRKHHHRPLLNTQDPTTQILTLMEHRRPLYQECAHLKLDTTCLGYVDLATGILECSRYFFNNPA
jgi:shikimate kinase